MLSEVFIRACLLILLEVSSTLLIRNDIRNVDKVDQTMDSIREQMDLSNEISEAISNPVGMGNAVDEVCFRLLRCFI